MTLVTAAAAADPATWNDLINYIPSVIMNAGMSGLWILAYLKDWIVSAKTYERKCKEADARTAERDAWQNRYFDAVAAHRRTLEGLLTSTQQASRDTDSARMSSIIEVLHQMRARHVPPGRRPSGR
jgi:hypothetical protein